MHLKLGVISLASVGLAGLLAYSATALAGNCGNNSSNANCSNSDGGTSCLINFNGFVGCSAILNGPIIATAFGNNQGQTNATLFVERTLGNNGATFADTFGFDSNQRAISACRAVSIEGDNGTDSDDTDCEDAVAHDVFALF